MSLAFSLCRSASRLASSVRGGRLARVRSISSFVNRQAPAAAIDDWISSEQAVIGAIDSEFYGPVIVVDNDPVDSLFAHMWRDPSTKPRTPPDCFPFKVEDIPGNPTVTFTREHNGEHIKVVASMPNVYDDDDGPSTVSNDDDGPSTVSNDDDGPRTESNDDDGPSNESNDDDDGYIIESNDYEISTPIPLVMTVTKNSGLSLEFSCMALSEDFSIDALYVNLPGHSLEDRKVIRGLDNYKGLDENLQKTFNKYLEIRGLDPDTSLTMHIYMLDKIKREYWLLLKYVKEFMEEGKIDS